MDHEISDSSDQLDELQRPTLYIGIGASAGGLEALREFFTSISSSTDCAFIVVQHLSPDHASIMDELLARTTSMAVQKASDGVLVERNSVYVIPPRKNMSLKEGRLCLMEQPNELGINLPIDIFFRSLAEDAHQRAVAIVMSGTGSDGSRGIKSVKESGGLILVQDPDSSKFDGMPYNAVNTGYADFVMAPSQLAAYVENYVSHPMVASIDGPGRSVLETSDDSRVEIFALLRRHAQIDFSYYKSSTVIRRIERRMGINQVSDLQSYLSLLRNSEKEVHTLAREILINVTRFFRGKEAFEYLERNVIKSLVEQADDSEEIRVWIAGCSTGEEAYSVAILLDEALGGYPTQRKVKIFATDLDASAIARASLGQYSTDIEADMTTARLTRYFDRKNDSYVLRRDIRQMVVFATHNMITDPPFSNIDLVCCRNVLIYFQSNVQQKVISSFHFALKTRGMAFFGASESIGELRTYLEPINEKHRIFRKKNSIRPPVVPILPSANLPTLQPSSRLVSHAPRNYRSNKRDSLFEHVKDSLINDHVPACLILDMEHHAVHLYGDANKYLTRFPAGRISTNIHDVINDQLAVAVGTALTRAESEGKPVYYTNISAHIANTDLLIKLQCEYFPEKLNNPGFFVLILDDSQSSDSNPSRAAEAFNVAEQTQQRIRDLETELTHSKESLQFTNEELETTNEELQSTNEELMSSNEELQSANEELQSVNEELFSVNNEFQEKINDLSVANDDLDNVLSFAFVGVVIVDGDMRIRKFTQVATHYFNLMNTDIGRPLHHISNSLEYPELFDDIKSVISVQDTRERGIKTTDGNLTEVKLVPYLSSADGVRGRRLGAIVTLIDLSSRLSDKQQAETRLPHVSGVDTSNTRGAPLPRVLVFDPDKDSRSSIVRVLREGAVLPLDIIEVDSIEEASDVARSHSLDLCLASYPRDDTDATIELIDGLLNGEDPVQVIVCSDRTREETLGDFNPRLSQVLPSVTTMHLLCGSELSARMLNVSMRKALNYETC